MPHYKATYRKLKKREVIKNGDKWSCDGGNYHTISEVLPGKKVDDDLSVYFDIYRKIGVEEIPTERTSTYQRHLSHDCWGYLTVHNCTY